MLNPNAHLRTHFHMSLKPGFMIGLMVGLMTTLAACSSGSSGSSGNGPAEPGADGKPQEGFCDQVLTQDRLDDFNKSHQLAFIAGVSGMGQSICEMNQSVDGQTSKISVVGFAGVYAIPSFVVKRDSALTGTGSANVNLELVVEETKLSKAQLDLVAQALEQKFGAAIAQKPEVLSQRISFESLALADLPEVPTSTRSLPQADTENTKSRLAISFDAPISLRAHFENRLSEFAAGSATVQFVSSKSYASGSVLLGEAKNNTPIRMAAFTKKSAAQYLVDRWMRIERHGSSALDDTSLPFAWMQVAMDWWPHLKLQTSDAKLQWSGSLLIANRLWNPRKDVFNRSKSDLLTALRFISMVDSGSQAARSYGRYLREIEPYLLFQPELTYSEITDLVERESLSAEQESALFRMARKLDAAKTSVNVNPWIEARQIASRTAFSEAALDLILEAMLWHNKASGRDSFAQAKAWVIENGLTTSGLAQMKTLLQTLEKKMSTRSALEKTIDLAINRKLEQVRIDAYTQVFGWLSEIVSNSATVEKTDRFVLELAIDSATLEALKGHYKWLASQISSYRALEKVESHVIGAGLKANELSHMKLLFETLEKFVSTSRALEKAEQYLITSRITSEQAQAIVAACDWLKNAVGSSQVVDRAEKYVVTNKLGSTGVAQIQRLSSLYSTLMSSSRALEKAELLVLDKRLTVQQTELLETSLRWLQGMLSASSAINKAEDYLLNKKLTLEMFQQLKKSFELYSKTMSQSRSLEKAEKETFGTI